MRSRILYFGLKVLSLCQGKENRRSGYMDLLDKDKALNLNNIRSALIRIEGEIFSAYSHLQTLTFHRHYSFQFY